MGFEGRETWTARARKEVILCAGALKTPQLLMLSGIGDADHLRSVGIDPLLHLPGVGLHLQDHLAAAAPIINPNYLGDDQDMVIWRTGFTLLRRLMAAPGWMNGWKRRSATVPRAGGGRVRSQKFHHAVAPGGNVQNELPRKLSVGG